MSIIIGFAGPHDIEKIATLWEKLVKELAPEYAPNASWWAGMASVLITTDTYRAITAIDEETGEMVGFIDGFLYPEPSTGKLHAVGQHFFVLPEYRNTSIPARLYREAIKVAKEAGAQVMELFCFLKEMAFWESKGFLPVRTMMRRPLNV